jgi:hypothetical protein
MPEKHNDTTDAFGIKLPPPPTVEQQNWGAMLSIVIIVLMIIIGAFYAWNKRTAEQPAYPTTAENALPANY